MGLALTIWGALAAGIAGSGLVAGAPFAAPLFIGLGTAALVLVVRRDPRARAGAATISTRTVLLAHALRAPIGAGFLAALHAGELPRAFAMRAGIGDIVVGVAAVGVALLGAGRRSHPPLVWIWNALGLADILLAVATAQRALLFEHDPLVAQALGRLPYGLLPTFVVPLVIGTHILLFLRLMAERRGRAARHAT